MFAKFIVKILLDNKKFFFLKKFNNKLVICDKLNADCCAIEEFIVLKTKTEVLNHKKLVSPQG